MTSLMDRLPLCNVIYVYGGQVLSCNRAEGHRGRHRVTREALFDEVRIRARREDD